MKLICINPTSTLDKGECEGQPMALIHGENMVFGKLVDVPFFFPTDDWKAATHVEIKNKHGKVIRVRKSRFIY